jgi:hypothetical protein
LVEIITFFILKAKCLDDKKDIFTTTNTHIETKFKTISTSFNNIADLAFNSYINKSEVKNLFKNHNRDGLYDLLQDDYFYLKKLGFNQVHFHTAQNESFLRMHKRYKFGDDLTNTRYSVKYVNETKKPILGGFEAGMIVPGFRYLYPFN